jgi:adenylate kinase family enzyme
LPLCIYIDINEEEAEKRLLVRGRADDNRAAIRNRLQYFPKDVMPVIRHYRRHRRIIRVDGSVAPELVWQQIDRKLSKRLGEKWPRE